MTRTIRQRLDRFLYRHRTLITQLAVVLLGLAAMYGIMYLLNRRQYPVGP